VRFSTVFQQTPTPRPRPGEEDVRTEVAPPPSPGPEAPELPEELDARVRLIGEWQLGES